MIGTLLYTTMAANEIAPFGLAGTRELTRQPTRKLKLTRDTQRCLDYNDVVNGACEQVHFDCLCVSVYLTTVGNSSMLYRMEMKMAARMQSFPSRARLITSTGSPARTVKIP